MRTGIPFPPIACPQATQSRMRPGLMSWVQGYALESGERSTGRDGDSGCCETFATGPTGRRADRKSVVSGKSVSVRVDLGGRRVIKKKNTSSTIISVSSKHITHIHK